MSNSQLEQELPELLLSSVRNIIDGNHVQGKELTLEDSAVYPFKLTVTVDWEFCSEWQNERIAGGKAASVHSGMDVNHFNATHDNYTHDAATNKIKRLDFINSYKNAGTHGLVHNNKKVIHNYPTHSYHYYCNECDGNKEVNCNSCSGQGRKQCTQCWGTGQVQENYTEYNNWNKTYENRSRYVSCGHCRATGRTTCYSCSGSGRQQCSPCEGYGYFTYYRSTKLVAIPSNKFHVNCQEYSQKLVNYLAQRSLDHVAKHIYFNGFNYNTVGQSYERFIYYGDSFVTDILTNLRAVQHRIVGYSNPPLAFIRSGIFDQLFIEEISALEEYQGTGKKIPKDKALKFFNKFSGQPVLERSLRGVAKHRTSTEQDHTAMIQENCAYFITQTSATRLADGINAILDKVSPAYSGLVWGIGAFIYFLAVGIYLEYVIEISNLSGKWGLFLELMSFIFFTFLYYCAYSFITFLISVIVCHYKSRNVPQEFRQQFRNNEPFISTTFIGCFFVLMMGIYGYAANHTTWLPKAGPTFLNFVFKSADYIVPDQLVHKYCEDERSYFLDERNDKLICGSKYFMDTDQFSGHAIFYGEPQRRIQEILSIDDPNIVIDGKIGTQTKQAIADYFEKHHLDYDESWSFNQIALRMENQLKNY